MQPSNDRDRFLNAMRFRHACKRFDPAREIPKEDFDAILESARLSPSSFGFEPWKLIVLTDEEVKRQLHPIAWGARNSLDGASRFVILLARRKPDMLYSSDFITHMMRDIQKQPPEVMDQRRAKYRSFQEDDFELLESDRAIFDWACKQTYIALANMMTAAAYMGIDSCPIEGFHRRKVDTLLAGAGLYDNAAYGVSVMAGFGYRAEPPHREKTRQPMEDIIIWH